MAHQQTRRSFLIDDAAEILGVSRRTVYYRIRQGRLATVRTRGGSQRVLLSSIERLLRQEHGLPPLEDAAADADSEPQPPAFQVQPFP
jgi:excisionase family DNA binding protein